MKKSITKIFNVLALLTILSMIFVGCSSKQEPQNVNLLDQIKNSGKMKVGLMGTYPPYNFLNKNNEVDGFDADIAKEIAKRIGVEAEFITTDWSSMVAGLEKGKFDIVVSQMTITDERKQTMDFSKPYIKNTVNVIVRSDNNTINSVEDFKNKKIGVGLGTNDEQYLRDDVMPKVGNFEIITYNDVITSLMDLNTGRIDATINNIFAIKPEVEKNNIHIKTVGKPLKEDFAGMAIRKENPEFLKAVDQALEDMKNDGTYKKIFIKWFDVEPNI
ncbi:transporter substrate-binding domain-containing protein [Inediibacterium massiliense]|uniref:transporter substrate-binding domain-containing protein n=1 Tax=Inediibacterium massiliense TaxID=1658111 RepID=UPI0006B45462|nr:transporter substrate-binding domain-containing protein [Inediibacterium massiliense]